MKTRNPIIAVKSGRIITLEKKLVLLKLAHEKHPENTNVLGELILVLAQLGNRDRALEHIDKLGDMTQLCEQQHQQLFQSWYHLDDFERAIDTYEILAVQKEQSTELTLLYCESLIELNRFSKARQSLNSVLDNDSTNLTALSLLLRLQSVNPTSQAGTTALAERILRLQPQNARAKACMIEMRSPGDFLELSERYRQLTYVARLTPTYGQSEFDKFNKLILNSIFERSDWCHEPPKIATTGGAQLFKALQDKPNIHQTFIQHINEHIYCYIAEAQKISPSFFALPNNNVEIDIWAVSLARGGHQAPHIHPSGFISGVYYSQAKGEAAELGKLEFGFNNSNGKFTVLHDIIPEEGMLILFPSYFRHRTQPFSGKGTRVSISFDIKLPNE